jgi:galactose mutarotase-like enzyme
MQQAESHDTLSIASPELQATVSMRGAELVRLRDGEGRELLWDGDPAFWTGRSPLLFPIIGRIKDDTLAVDGVNHTMRQHGIVRTRRFSVLSSESASCLLRLEADDETRAAFPFDFVLDVAYRVQGLTLSIAATVRNTGARALPASFGYHPAFRWPLPYGGAREAHELVFAEEEPGPLHRLGGGLLSLEERASPVAGRKLALRDDLFVEDALIFLAPRSRSVHYGAPGHRGLRVDYPDMPQLGIWTKPGAGFLCIEPWYGYASPQGFAGDFSQKPGLVSIPAGGDHRFGISVTLDKA